MSTATLPPTRGIRLHVWLVIGLMLVCVAGTEFFKPSRYISDVTGEPDLQSIIPKQFGEWQQSPYGGNSIVDPKLEEAVAAIYTSTLNRVYIHRPTRRVLMLSLAYGRDQSTATQAHAPEACYGGNGFRINERLEQTFASPFGNLKIVRLKTNLGLRVEPLTYFIRVGDAVARGSLERQLKRMQYATRGFVVDGLLFRISEITSRPDPFDLQDAFINDLLRAMPPADRRQLIGSDHV